MDGAAGLLALIEAAVFILLMRRMVSRPLNKVIGAFDSLAQATWRSHPPYVQDEFAALLQALQRDGVRLEESVSRQHRAEMGAQRPSSAIADADTAAFSVQQLLSIYRICRMGTARRRRIRPAAVGYYEYVTRSPQARAMWRWRRNTSTHSAMQDPANPLWRKAERALCPALPAAERPACAQADPAAAAGNAVKYNLRKAAGCAAEHRGFRPVERGLHPAVGEDNGTRLTDADVEALRRAGARPAPYGQQRP